MSCYVLERARSPPQPRAAVAAGKIEGKGTGSCARAPYRYDCLATIDVPVAVIARCETIKFLKARHWQKFSFHIQYCTVLFH